MNFLVALCLIQPPVPIESVLGDEDWIADIDKRDISGLIEGLKKARGLDSVGIRYKKDIVALRYHNNYLMEAKNRLGGSASVEIIRRQLNDKNCKDELSRIDAIIDVNKQEKEYREFLKLRGWSDLSVQQASALEKSCTNLDEKMKKIQEVLANKENQLAEHSVKVKDRIPNFKSPIIPEYSDIDEILNRSGPSATNMEKVKAGPLTEATTGLKESRIFRK